MTTFQDPPPQSRRAVRQSERGDNQAQVPVEAAPYTFDAPEASVETPESPVGLPTTGRRAQPTAFDQSAPFPAAGLPAPSGFEPLTYTTQNRVFPPTDSLPTDSLPADPPARASAAAPQFESPGQSGFRVRDFTPEGGRRAAGFVDPMLQSPLSAAASFPAPAPPVDLEYHTQAAVPAPAPLDDVLNHTLSRRELRELRAAAELEAPALQLPPVQLPEPIDTLLNSGPIDIPTLAPPPGQSQALADAMAEFDLLTRSRREAEARARDAQVASLATPIVSTPPQLVVPPSAPAPSAPAQPAPVSWMPVNFPPVPPVPPVQSVQSVPVQSVPVPVQSVPVPVSSVPVQSVPISWLPAPSVPVPPAPVGAAPLFFPPPVQSAQQQFAPVAPVFTSPVFTSPVFTSPVFAGPLFLEPQLESDQARNNQAGNVQTDASQMNGNQTGDDQTEDEHGGRSPRASNHWRVQAAIEDDELPYENTLSRTVGVNTSAITTSALVLPSIPQPDSMLASLTATGEILVTGSISLPRSLGSTGAHPDRVDNSDYEDDPFDSQVIAPDSAPVRATRAISSHTSTRGVIETKRPRGNRMLTAVIIVASVLCVGLVGLLIFAFATNRL